MRLNKLIWSYLELIDIVLSKPCLDESDYYLRIN